MTREELQAFVLGFVDHRLAVIEERLSGLEHPTLFSWRSKWRAKLTA
jgi:hypothetical protein